MSLLRTVGADQLRTPRRELFGSATLTTVDGILADVRERGDAALRHYGEQFGEVAAGDPLVIERPEMERALESLGVTQRGLLERTAARIDAFARAQRKAITAIDVAVDGGRAGQSIAPVERAGCYAPGGAYALPSTVLMTAVTAKAAGVRDVWVATPRANSLMLAAAALAGADAVLAVGGAHAIGAFAYGSESVPASDVIVGPGNRWVTAAKQRVAGQVGIDMLAGPSELVVVADGDAPAPLVAADLIAQAEHDADALPILVSTDGPLIQQVQLELERQLATLSTANIARRALKENGFAVLCRDVAQAIDVCNRLAPEHLELMIADAEAIAQRCVHYGALFIGAATAEIHGDYGAGPNHVLPTSGTARFTGGLSIHTFLRIRTWLHLRSATPLTSDTCALARLEGLEGHARAAELRTANPFLVPQGSELEA